MSLTKYRLQELYEYDSALGALIHRHDRYSNKVRGKRAGYVTKNGRRALKIDNKSYLEHRLIFLFHYGYLPSFIDHKDGNPLNNRIENLREATKSQNQVNKKAKANRETIYKGVSLEKRSGKWKASIGYTTYGKKKVKNLGRFMSDIDAAKAYDKAALEIYGEYALLNFPEK